VPPPRTEVIVTHDLGADAVATDDGEVERGGLRRCHAGVDHGPSLGAVLPAGTYVSDLEPTVARIGRGQIRG
jgi:hypothetical protein